MFALMYAPSAIATLMVEGGVVTDDHTGLVWLADMSKYRDMTYEPQQVAINGLDFDMRTNWRLATDVEVRQLLENGLAVVSNIFIETGVEVNTLNGATETSHYWYGRTSSFDPGRTTQRMTEGLIHTFLTTAGEPVIEKWTLIFNNEYEETHTPLLGAWVVADPVPEPATMLLLGSGLIGLAGIRRKFRNKSGSPVL